ncbi:MAG: hypothetical protein KDA89_00615, partial [Planctomycetaceae bacterium]|nr:hypothetical protein [Planctomycetaceae bacterium]
MGREEFVTAFGFTVQSAFCESGTPAPTVAFEHSRRPADFVAVDCTSRETATAYSFPRSPFHGFAVREMPRDRGLPPTAMGVCRFGQFNSERKL